MSCLLCQAIPQLQLLSMLFLSHFNSMFLLVSKTQVNLGLRLRLLQLGHRNSTEIHRSRGPHHLMLLHLGHRNSMVIHRSLGPHPLMLLHLGHRNSMVIRRSLGLRLWELILLRKLLIGDSSSSSLFLVNKIIAFEA